MESSLRKVELLEFGKGDGGKLIVRADAIVLIENCEGKATIITLKSTHRVDESYETARSKWKKVTDAYDPAV